MGPKVNAKAQAGRARKEETAVQKAAAANAAKDAELAKEWSKGANEKGQSRVDDAAARADEAARKRQEKAALQAAEEAALGSGGKVSKVPTLSKKKGVKKNDLFELENALVTDATKKARAKKQAELERKQKEEQAAKERAAAKEQEALRIDPLMLNTDMMLEGAVGREGNVLAMETAMTAGLDGALQSLSISVPGSEIKSQKALYMAFEEKTLPIVKQEYPGLRLSQYKEKVFALWKKSPDNPQNQVPA